METHKIQSGGSNGIDIHLDPVPKMLKTLKSWSPKSFIVSFKLETDPDLVIKKARGAIEKYGVHLVVANQLQVSSSQPTNHIHSCNLFDVDKEGCCLSCGYRVSRY